MNSDKVMASTIWSCIILALYPSSCMALAVTKKDVHCRSMLLGIKR